MGPSKIGSIALEPFSRLGSVSLGASAFSQKRALKVPTF